MSAQRRAAAGALLRCLMYSGVIIDISKAPIAGTPASGYPTAMQACDMDYGVAANEACCPAEDPMCGLPSTCPTRQCAVHFRALIDDSSCWTMIKEMSHENTALIRDYQALYADCWDKFPPASNESCVSPFFRREVRTVAGGPIDFQRCARWGDGCNECLIENDLLVGCTAKVCPASNKVNPACEQLNDLPHAVDPLLHEARAYLDHQTWTISSVDLAVLKSCSYTLLDSLCQSELNLDGAKSLFHGPRTSAAVFCTSRCRSWSYEMYLLCAPKKFKIRDKVLGEAGKGPDRSQVVSLLDICRDLHIDQL